MDCLCRGFVLSQDNLTLFYVVVKKRVFIHFFCKKKRNSITFNLQIRCKFMISRLGIINVY